MVCHLPKQVKGKTLFETRLMLSLRGSQSTHCQLSIFNLQLCTGIWRLGKLVKQISLWHPAEPWIQSSLFKLIEPVDCPFDVSFCDPRFDRG